MSSSLRASEPDLPFWLRRAPRPELAGLVVRMVGYCENGWRLSEAVEMASLVVPLVISFGAPFSIALGRKPAHGRRSCQLRGRPLCRPRRDEFGRRLRLRPDRLHAARRLPLLRPADARIVRPHGEPRRSGGRRNHRASPQAGRRRAIGTHRLDLDRDVRGRAAAAWPLSPAGAVVSAYRELAFCHGNIRIEAIATRLGWSRKHLSQRFQDEIGLSPKSLARMIRFNRAARPCRTQVGSGLGRPRRRMRLCRPGASDARIRRVRRHNAGSLAGRAA